MSDGVCEIYLIREAELLKILKTSAKGLTFTAMTGLPSPLKLSALAPQRVRVTSALLWSQTVTSLLVNSFPALKVN